MKVRSETHQTWSWGRPSGAPPQLSPLPQQKMAKNENWAKVSKKHEPNVSRLDQSMQQYCNIAGDILNWDFLPPCLLFKTPRTQWFDNDLIARYLQFEYSEATLTNGFFTQNHSAWTLYRSWFNGSCQFWTVCPEKNTLLSILGSFWTHRSLAAQIRASGSGCGFWRISKAHFSARTFTRSFCTPAINENSFLAAVLKE